jgi:hypothetical protein
MKTLQSRSKIDLLKTAAVLMNSKKTALKRIGNRLLKEKEGQMSGHSEHSAGGTHTESNL